MKHRQEKSSKKDYEERRSIMDASPIHVAIAGRMMFKRVMGKASFCNIQDLQGQYPGLCGKRRISEKRSYADFKKSDIGDILGRERICFSVPRTGEISIHAEKMTTAVQESYRSFRRNSTD